MCIDFTDLNKHCPKDHFPLPRLDQIVDSTTGWACLTFLDAYSGYNQIRLKVEDQELTAFITPAGVYCYNVMTFGLKNTGATYQRCMQACLGKQIGKNIEVYTAHRRPARNLRQPRAISNQAEPEEMLLRSTRRPSTRIPHIRSRY